MAATVAVDADAAPTTHSEITYTITVLVTKPRYRFLENGGREAREKAIDKTSPPPKYDRLWTNSIFNSR